MLQSKVSAILREHKLIFNVYNKSVKRISCQNRAEKIKEREYGME